MSVFRRFSLPPPRPGGILGIYALTNVVFGTLGFLVQLGMISVSVRLAFLAYQLFGSYPEDRYRLGYARIMLCGLPLAVATLIAVPVSGFWLWDMFNEPSLFDLLDT